MISYGSLTPAYPGHHCATRQYQDFSRSQYSIELNVKLLRELISTLNFIIPVSATPGAVVKSHWDGMPEALVLVPLAVHVANWDPKAT